MLKELVLFLHRTAHRWCCHYELCEHCTAGAAAACRTESRNGIVSNVVLFFAIFLPFYFCLFRDMFRSLRDYKLVNRNR